MDVAALELKIDSSEIVKAANDLDRLAKASMAAGDSSAASSGSIARLVASVQSMNSKLGSIVSLLEKTAAANDNVSASAARSATKLDGLSNAAKRAADAARGVEAATSLAASATNTSNARISTTSSLLGKLASAYDFSRDAIAHWTNQLFQARNATTSATADIRKVTQAANDNAGAIRANSSNIAAQFQDIGVTAAMGMNPLTIGLQQGTQLSAVFAQSGASMGQVLTGAFRQIASAQALMTIGLVAAVAALLQLVDWSKLAQSAMSGLASVMVEAAPYAVGLGAVLAVAFGPQILSAIAATAMAIGRTLVAAIVAATEAMIAFAVANPFSFFVLAAAAATAAIVLVGKSFGKDFVTPIRDGINFVVGGFVGAFNAIKKTWSMLPAAIGDLVIQAANNTIRAVDNMVNRAIVGLNGLTAKVPGGSALQIGFRANSGQLANPNAGAAQRVNDIASESIRAAQKVDYVGKAIAGVTALAQKGADKLREWAKALGASNDKKIPRVGGAGAGSATLPKAAQPDPWGDLIANADKQQRTLDQAGARIGVYGKDLAFLTHQQELFNAAQDKGIPLTAAMTRELNERALKMANTDYDNTRRAAADATAKSHAEAMRQLEAERNAIGLAGTALVQYNYQQQLINAELAKGVELKDIDTAAIAKQAKAYADAVAANDAARKTIDNQRASLEANRQAAKGFFTDWIDGVRKGESVFKSFERSVSRSLNNLIDQMVNQMLNQMLGIGGAARSGGGFGGLLGSMFGSLFGSGGGILGSIVGSLFGGGGMSRSAFEAGRSSLVAPVGMNPWDIISSSQKFANGGAFTNSIVNNPTLFRYANGGKFGLMGEAGPEAVMPLKRGPNGALGVQMHGGGGKRSVGDVNVTNHYVINGGFTPESAVAMIRQGGEQTYAQVKRDLQSMLQQLDNDGTMVA